MLDTRCKSSDNRTKNFFDTGGESHRQRAPENYSGCGTAVYLHACTCAPIASRRSIKPKERTALALTIGFSSIGLLERAYRGMKAKLSRDSGGALSSQYFHSDALQKKDSTSEGNSHGDGYWRAPNRHPPCWQGVCVIFLRRARVVSAISVHVQRWRGALDDLFRDHDLLDAFEARQVEHGVE